MKIRVGAASDVGRAREHNEDGYIATAPLFAVADGMGGHKGGGVASKIALEVLAATVPDREALPERVREANRAVFERASDDRALSGMGTTLTAAITDDGVLHLAHVGDSRAYIFRDGRLEPLTEDHTLVRRMVREGRLTEEEAESHPQRSILTRALGVEEDVEVDERSEEVGPGDRVILCTDGLTGMLREESIAEILAGADDPQEAAERLVDAANRAGGLDNITVLILQFDEDEDTSVAAGGVAPVEAPAQPDVEPRAGGVAAELEEPPELRHAAPGAWWPRRRRLVLWLTAAVAVAAIGLVGARVYLDRQWYVGVDDGQVAVFQGLPTDFLGVSLSHPVERTGISSKTVEQLAPYKELAGGITVDSRQAALQVVDQIRRDLAARQQTPAKTGGTG